MSLKAITWVMESAPVESPAEMVILYALADRAHDDGRNAWPSHQWIADRAVCSRRTVIRHIKAMEKRGLIKRGDQRFVQHLPADKRPIVWDLNLKLSRSVTSATGCQSDTPEGSGVSSRAQRGDSSCKSGVSNGAERGDTGVTQTVLEPSLEPSLNQPPNPQGGKGEEADRFQEFYDIYPRKMKPRDAERAWKRAIKRADAQIIIEAARLFAQWCEATQKEKTFISYPASWLNADGWKNELEWPASPQQQSGNGLAAWGAPSTQGFGFSGDPFRNLRGPVIDHEETS